MVARGVEENLVDKSVSEGGDVVHGLLVDELVVVGHEEDRRYNHHKHSGEDDNLVAHGHDHNHNLQDSGMESQNRASVSLLYYYSLVVLLLVLEDIEAVRTKKAISVSLFPSFSFEVVLPLYLYRPTHNYTLFRCR